MTTDSLFGFRLHEKRFIQEVNAECLYFEHEKSGARLFKIASDDSNKTFCIAFKTLPDSDNGVPHILEHSVLNGSTGFPVKSPFDVLLKGSLHTFLNAMTGKDITMYPVASMNEKDYFNLMHVYLDAVFNPMIYHDPRILQQEGWHHELEAIDQPIQYKGVVYNEMKGSFSNPIRELWYQVFKVLFPDSVYGVESGGYPSEIPTLTQEQFIDFHRTYYHPENSYIYLYGNAPLERELEFIDKVYLSNYNRNGSRVEIVDQQPFAEVKSISGYYPITEGEDTDHQTFLTLNWVAGRGVDKALTMALEVLCELLVNQESAPIRLALQKAGIGQDVNASASVFQQNVVIIMARNANPDEKERFDQIVRSTLKEVIEKGLDKKEVEGVLNRLEFLLREGNDAQKGMTYIDQSYPGFFYEGDPFIGLEYEKSLTTLKTALTTPYLETIIEEYLLENQHCLLFSLEPKPGLDQEINRNTETELESYKESLSEEEKVLLVEQTKALIEYQQREESAENLASIPMLDIEDIEKTATWYQSQEHQVDQVPLLHFEEFTNGVVYSTLYFDLTTLTVDELPYASLLTNFLGLLDTETYTYGALNQALNIHTGGIYASLNAFLEHQSDDHLLPRLVVNSKAMTKKVSTLFDLTEEILLHTTFQDQDRMKVLFTRLQSQLDASIKRAGNRYSSIRLSSYYSNHGMYRELTEGLTFYKFVKEEARAFEEKPHEITAKLHSIVAKLFAKNNMVAATTCTHDQFQVYQTALARFIERLPDTAAAKNSWQFESPIDNEGIATASQVQYVMQGYNFKKLGYDWSGKMRVLNQVLSTDYLQTRIRVIGGAYGGYSTITPSGFMTFNSYRDPNLKETLENFKEAPEYLQKFEADMQTMTRYIIGTISSLDHPLTPSQKGEMAASHYFNKRKKEDLQHDRDAVLATTAADIQGFEGMIRQILAQNRYCVLGNEEKIKSEQALFNAIIKLDRYLSQES